MLRSGIISTQNNWFWLLISTGAFITLFIVPILTIKYVWKESPAKYGLKRPQNTKESIILTSTAIVFSFIVVILLSQTTNFKNFYEITHKINWLFSIEIALSLIYFIAEEFFFRGFLLFTFFEKYGNHSFWIVNIIFAILHANKAPGEMVLSFFFGLLLSFLSFRTKSFIPATVVHFIMALSLNLSIIFLN
jgi:membrane protease YdiL (CAAX protease family)